jgi:hypothetical protein
MTARSSPLVVELFRKRLLFVHNGGVYSWSEVHEFDLPQRIDFQSIVPFIRIRLGKERWIVDYKELIGLFKKHLPTFRYPIQSLSREMIMARIQNSRKPRRGKEVEVKVTKSSGKGTIRFAVESIDISTETKRGDYGATRGLVHPLYVPAEPWIVEVPSNAKNGVSSPEDATEVLKELLSIGLEARVLIDEIESGSASSKKKAPKKKKDDDVEDELDLEDDSDEDEESDDDSDEEAESGEDEDDDVEEDDDDESEIELDLDGDEDEEDEEPKKKSIKKKPIKRKKPSIRGRRK